MRPSAVAAAIILFVTPAWATATTQVPELSVNGATAALALLAGAAAIMRERSKRT